MARRNYEPAPPMQVEKFEFSRARRRAVPLVLGISSVSGGGKTYSALLIAAGLAGPNGKVYLADTENGRGEMYSDSPGIVAALPNGFSYGRLDAPFSPDRYGQIIDAAENDGADVLVVDSFTHEWEGIGGCQEIAENNKLRGMPNWSKAKMAHKKLMNKMLSTQMHIILCIRARDKVKIVEGGNVEIVQLGLTPVTEKNVVFEMMVSLLLEEKTHFATAIKVPEPLKHLFTGAKLLTREDGSRIRDWNLTGEKIDPLDLVVKRSRATAEEGMEAYQKHFLELSPVERKHLIDSGRHQENKIAADRADKEKSETAQSAVEKYSELPDPYEFGPESVVEVGGVLYKPNADLTGWNKVGEEKEESPASNGRVAGAKQDEMELAAEEV